MYESPLNFGCVNGDAIKNSNSFGNNGKNSLKIRKYNVTLMFY